MQGKQNGDMYTKGHNMYVISGTAMLIFMCPIEHYHMVPPQLANKISKQANMTFIVVENEEPLPWGYFIICDSIRRTYFFTKSACTSPGTSSFGHVCSHFYNSIRVPNMIYKLSTAIVTRGNKYIKSKGLYHLDFGQ